MEAPQGTLPTVPAHPEKIRGTVSLTHKQAALTLFGLMTFSQWKDFKEFITGDTDRNVVRIELGQKEGFDRVERKIEALLTKIELEASATRDLNYKGVADLERRCEARQSEIVARIGNLEVYAFKHKNRNGS